MAQLKMYGTIVIHVGVKYRLLLFEWPSEFLKTRHLWSYRPIPELIPFMGIFSDPFGETVFGK